MGYCKGGTTKKVTERQQGPMHAHHAAMAFETQLTRYFKVMSILASFPRTHTRSPKKASGRHFFDDSSPSWLVRPSLFIPLLSVWHCSLTDLTHSIKFHDSNAIKAPASSCAQSPQQQSNHSVQTRQPSPGPTRTFRRAARRILFFSIQTLTHLTHPLYHQPQDEASQSLRQERVWRLFPHR